MSHLENPILQKESIGGKAANLIELEKLGLEVPAFTVITASRLKQDKSPNFWKLLAEEILVKENFKEGDLRFAVRSSGVAEDGMDHSFAGQFETKLNVRPEEMAEAIKEVFESANNERVLEYRKERGIKGDNDVAIVIQKMLDPDVAGVAFGIHPVTGSTTHQVISSVYGLGEGLVSGMYNADTFVISDDGAIEKEIVKKDAKLVFNTQTNSGNIEMAVPLDQQEESSLSDPQLKEIQHVLKKLESHFNHPQDIEFAFENGNLFLLQTRPITTTNIKSAIPNEGDYIIWDNSNIVESYPGHSLPLGFSFIRKMYEAVYIQFASIMGVSKNEIEDNASVFANMLGILKGRVYYNLLSWYRALAMLPGYALNAEFMERMMGVKQRFELEDLPVRSKFKERIRVLNMVRIMIINLVGLPKMTRNFQRDFNGVMTEYNAINFEEKNSWELMRLYKRYEQTLLKKWKAPLVNDFYAMIYFGVLQKLVTKYKLDDSGTLHNNLLCGARDIVSTDPIKRCLNLSENILDNQKLKDQFISLDADQLYQAYLDGLFPENINQQIKEYIHKWGHRCVGELKLETITYRQNPAAFIDIIKTYVTQGIRSKENNVDLEMRASAEAQVKEKLKGKFLKKRLFNWVLKKTRHLVSNRENLRYERTRGYGTVRDIFSALGHNFKNLDAIESDRDIFYLTQEEIFDYIQGTSITDDLKALISLRKMEYASFDTAPKPAERIKTDGVVYKVNDLTSHHESEDHIDEADDSVIKGLGCCPGLVRKRVMVIHDPSEINSLNGDILVTVSTDPGWVTLFPTASGILVEKGSLLSHSAIVSREMGIPCVVGINGLIGKLKTGDVVEMNGSTGIVKLIENATLN